MIKSSWIEEKTVIVVINSLHTWSLLYRLVGGHRFRFLTYVHIRKNTNTNATASDFMPLILMQNPVFFILPRSEH